jgi:hypothetical protein
VLLHSSSPVVICSGPIQAKAVNVHELEPAEPLPQHVECPLLPAPAGPLR